ncbi:MAG: hypothetical protein WC717_02425 [Candidatus Micrarchaeia archaeon]|jgi:hypothetical protein
MAAQTETYCHLDREWRTLCRMLLGGEIVVPLSIFNVGCAKRK